jgi:hypothetical protein
MSTEMAKTVVTMGSFAAGGYLLGRSIFQVPEKHKAVVYNEQDDSVGGKLEPGIHIRMPFVEHPWIYNMEPAARETRSACRTSDGRAFECVLEAEVGLMEDRLEKYRGIDRDQYIEKVFPALGRASMAFAAKHFKYTELNSLEALEAEMNDSESTEKKGGLGSWLASFGFAGKKREKEEKQEYIRMTHFDRRRQLTKQADLKFRELAGKFDLEVHGPVYLPTLESDGDMADLSEGVARIMQSGAADQFEGMNDKALRESLLVAAEKLGIKMEDRPAVEADDDWHMRTNPGPKGE